MRRSADTRSRSRASHVRINDEFTVDVMNSASGFTWNELVPYRTRIDGIQMLSLEGLLLMKEKGRLKDQADAEMIRRALHPGDQDRRPAGDD